MPDNQVSFIGNLTKDPELRWTNSQKPVASLSVAVNRRRKVGDDWQEETSFFDVTCWDSLATNVCSSLLKGNRVVVTGRLEQRSWEGEGGTKHSKVEIVADDVAPSLRWATAEVTRTPPQGTGQQNPQAPAQGFPDAATGAAREPEEDIF